MLNHSKAIAFDVDAASLANLRQALPNWKIEALQGTTAASLARAWDLGAARLLGADLLVVGTRNDGVESLGLCRGLRSQLGWAGTPLLVLLLPDQGALARTMLEVGANTCLVLPICAQDLAGMHLNTPTWAEERIHCAETHRNREHRGIATPGRHR